MPDHHCPQNKTRNEVWPETDWCKPMLVLVGNTETGRFEHSERINFCPYCGKDLRIAVQGVTLTFNYGGCLSGVSVTKSFRTRNEMKRYLRCFDYIPGKAVLCWRCRKTKTLDYVGKQNTPLLLGSIEIGE